MRNDRDAYVLYMRWTEVLGDWIVCEKVDRGAIPFVRLSRLPIGTVREDEL